jgi:hypothetical protein
MNATSRLTAAELKRFRLVSVDTNGKLVHCPAGGACVGSLQEGGAGGVFAADTPVSPDAIEVGKEVTLEAGEALAIGEFFKAGAYGGNDGYAVKDATKSVDTLGEVRSTASEAGAKFKAEYTR